MAGLVLALVGAACLPPDDAALDSPAETSPTAPRPQGTYRVGQCITWDQDGTGTVPEATRVVPCRDEHRLEVTGTTKHGSLAAYPTEEQWRVFFRTGACQAFAEAFLGRFVDPNGTLALTGIKPTASLWSTRGIRDVTCGLAASDDDPAARFTARAGSAVGQDQTLIRPVGSCVVRDPATATVAVRTRTVPCTATHNYEITGVADIAGRVNERPSTGAQWDALAGSDCGRLAESLLGRRPDGRFVRAVWFEIPPESWRAGRRKVECAVARFDDNGAVLTYAGQLKDTMN